MSTHNVYSREDPSRAFLGTSAVQPAFDWNGKAAVWPVTKDTSSGGKAVLLAKTECGTVLKASGNTREESATSRLEEDVFSNIGECHHSSIAERKLHELLYPAEYICPANIES